MSKKFTAVRLLCAFGIAFVLTVAIIFGVSEEPVTAIYNLFLGPLQSKRHFFDVFASSVPLIFTGLALGLVFKSGNFSMIADACLYTGAVVTAALAIKTALPAGLHPAVIMLLAAVVGCCVFFSWRGARQLRAIAAGLDTIADGGTVELPTTGYAGELADAVNRASEQLRRRKEIIARRDDARTNWIAGVSHDVRTPLALILGWAEQLEQDAALPAAVRQKAGDIRTQSEKLRALIEDLNLTSKLQYGAQPLRRQPVQAGPLLRRLAAEFCESPLAAGCDMAVELPPDADKAVLHADAALLGRAVENLLNNAARHNAPGVHITLAAVLRENALELTVADDGAGYPAAVLHALQTGETGANTPHILGLHVVEQIAQAHGGSVQFMQNAPQGAKAVVTLPTENQAHR